MLRFVPLLKISHIPYCHVIDIFVRLSLQYFTTLYYLMYTPDSNCEIAVRMANFVMCVDDVIHTGPVTPSFENGEPDVRSLILRVLSQICPSIFVPSKIWGREPGFKGHLSCASVGLCSIHGLDSVIDACASVFTGGVCVNLYNHTGVNLV